MAPNRTSESLYSCHYLYWRRPETYRNAFIVLRYGNVSNDSLNPRLNEGSLACVWREFTSWPLQPVT